MPPTGIASDCRTLRDIFTPGFKGTGKSALWRATCGTGTLRADDPETHPKCLLQRADRALLSIQPAMPATNRIVGRHRTGKKHMGSSETVDGSSPAPRPTSTGLDNGRWRLLVAELGAEIAHPLTAALERIHALISSGRIDRTGLRALRGLQTSDCSSRANGWRWPTRCRAY